MAEEHFDLENVTHYFVLADKLRSIIIDLGNATLADKLRSIIIDLGNATLAGKLKSIIIIHNENDTFCSF